MQTSLILSIGLREYFDRFLTLSLEIIYSLVGHDREPTREWVVMEKERKGSEGNEWKGRKGGKGKQEKETVERIRKVTAKLLFIGNESLPMKAHPIDPPQKRLINNHV